MGVDFLLPVRCAAFNPAIGKKLLRHGFTSWSSGACADRENSAPTDDYRHGLYVYSGVRNPCTLPNPWHKLLRLLSSRPQRNLNGSSTHFNGKTMKIKQSHKLLKLLSGRPQRNLNGSSTHFQLKKQSLLLHLRFARLGIFKILKGRHHTAILGSGLV